MPKVICELENASGSINGIEFVPHEDGVRSISKKDVGEPHLSIFLSIPGYSVDAADYDGKKDQDPPSDPAQKQETAAQRKARLKAEQDATAKAEADRLAEEEAQRLAAEEAAKQQGAGDKTETAGNGQDEVF